MELADTEFLFRVYAGTRRTEVGEWGWDAAQQEAFLRMQFNLQRRSYALQFPGAEEHIIVQSGARIGRLLLFRTERVLRIVDLAILPEWQNRGLGSALLTGLQREAASAGLRLALSVASGNPAKRLYQRLGFVVTGETGTHYEMAWHGVRD